MVGICVFLSSPLIFYARRNPCCAKLFRSIAAFNIDLEKHAWGIVHNRNMLEALTVLITKLGVSVKS